MRADARCEMSARAFFFFDGGSAVWAVALKVPASIE